MLFDLLKKVYIENCDDAIWDIILMFDPLLRRSSLDPLTLAFDHDLYADMQLILFHRIKRYRFRKFFE